MNLGLGYKLKHYDYKLSVWSTGINTIYPYFCLISSFIACSLEFSIINLLSVIVCISVIVVPVIIDWYYLRRRDIDTDRELNSVKVKVKRENGWILVHWSELRINDLVKYVPGDYVPLQSEIYKGRGVKVWNWATSEIFSDISLLTPGVTILEGVCYATIMSNPSPECNVLSSPKIKIVNLGVLKPSALITLVVSFLLLSLSWLVLGIIFETKYNGLVFNWVIFVVIFPTYFESLRNKFWMYNFLKMKEDGIIINDSDSLIKINNIDLLVFGSEMSVIKPYSYQVKNCEVSNKTEVMKSVSYDLTLTPSIPSTGPYYAAFKYLVHFDEFNYVVDNFGFSKVTGDLHHRNYGGDVISDLSIIDIVDDASVVDPIREDKILDKERRYNLIPLFFRRENVINSLISLDGIFYTSYEIQLGARNDITELVECFGIKDILLFSTFRQEAARRLGTRIGLPGRPSWPIDAERWYRVAWGDPFCGYPNIISIAKCSNYAEVANYMQQILEKMIEINHNTGIAYISSGQTVQVGKRLFSLTISIPNDPIFLRTCGWADVLLTCSPNQTMYSVKRLFMWGKACQFRISLVIVIISWLTLISLGVSLRYWYSDKPLILLFILILSSTTILPWFIFTRPLSKKEVEFGMDESKDGNVGLGYLFKFSYRLLKKIFKK